MNGSWSLLWALPLSFLLAQPLPVEAKAWNGPVVSKVTVVPAGDRIEVRVGGSGDLSATIMVLKGPKRLVLDFAGARYRAPKYALKSRRKVLTGVMSW